MSTFKENLEPVLDGFLQDYTFEDFLEEFNLTPLDVFICAYDNGLVDEELFTNYMSNIDG